MLQNLQNFVIFQNFQFDNLVDFEKCCKTRIFLQKSVPIQPKTSNILPKFAKKWQLPYGSEGPIPFSAERAAAEQGAHHGARQGPLSPWIPYSRTAEVAQQFGVSDWNFSVITKIASFKANFCW